MNEDQSHINVPMFVENLQTSHLETGAINQIPIDDFYYQSEPSTIEGFKQFEGLNVKNAKMSSINGVCQKSNLLYVIIANYQFDSIFFLQIRKKMGVNFLFSLS